jgi:putative lipase involved disintegration of autophagic bodies
MFSLFPVALRVLFASLPWTTNQLEGATPGLTFQLRHQHGVTNDSRVLFSDIAPSFVAGTYAVNTRHVDIQSPLSYSDFTRARLRSMRHMQSESFLWEKKKVLGPDVQSRDTLLQLAKMTHNSYFETDHPQWYELDGWNSVSLSTLSCGFASYLRICA